MRAFTNNMAATPLLPAWSRQMGCRMNRLLHRIVMGVLLVGALMLFWHLLGR